jgi:hypothetical protein
MNTQQVPERTAAESGVAGLASAARAARRRSGHGLVVALIPAQDEEAQIYQAIRSLDDQESPPDLIVVCADNCSDATPGGGGARHPAPMELDAARVTRCRWSAEGRGGGALRTPPASPPLYPALRLRSGSPRRSRDPRPHCAASGSISWVGSSRWTASVMPSWDPSSWEDAHRSSPRPTLARDGGAVRRLVARMLEGLGIR